MKWSWKIARVANIDIRVHVTFSLLLIWVASSVFLSGGSLAVAVGALLFTVAVFATVVLHELGHALTARVFGIPTREILLLPIGGVARLEGMPRNAKQEFLIALAGPAVNVVLAVLLGLAMLASGTRFDASADALSQPLLMRLLAVNVALALFNLIPAFPLDGGRVLRSLLSLRLPALRATEIAARVGRGLAMLFGVWGVLYSPMLLLIGVFVWFAAGAELAAARAHSNRSMWRPPRRFVPGAVAAGQPGRPDRTIARTIVVRPSWAPPGSR